MKAAVRPMFCATRGLKMNGIRQVAFVVLTAKKIYSTEEYREVIIRRVCHIEIIVRQ